MDVHVRRSVTTGLRRRGVDVLTAQEDGCATLDDGPLLERATALDRVLVSQDDDLLREAVVRQNRAETFSGVFYAHQRNITIRRSIDDLELLAKACRPEEISGIVVYLPLR